MKTNFILLLLLAALFSCTKKNIDIPLPEHPRPDFEREVWQNLNGYWYFKPDSADMGLSNNWQEEAGIFDKKVLVPFSWASPLSEIELPKVDIGWYYRTFSLDDQENWEGKRVYLIFCASDFNTTVWINGTEIGHHSGG